MLVRISLFSITELSLKVNLLLYICNPLVGEKELSSFYEQFNLRCKRQEIGERV